MDKLVHRLTDLQKQELQELEPRLSEAVSKGDYDAALLLVSQIQNLLRPTGHESRLNLAKNRLYEVAIKAEKFSIAESGLLGVLQKSGVSTRNYLESAILLAICFLRQENMEKATKYIEISFDSAKNIRSKERREEFRVAMAQRFEEEALLKSLAKKKTEENISADQVQESAGKIISSKLEHELYIDLGANLTSDDKRFVQQVNEESVKQLTAREKIFLPPPEVMPKEEEWGKKIFNSLKRSTWRALCDPESETYKMWYKKGVTSFFGKAYLPGAIIGSLAGHQIGNYAIITYFTALVMRLGLDTYCDSTKPKDIMEYRRGRT